MCAVIYHVNRWTAKEVKGLSAWIQYKITNVTL